MLQLDSFTCTLYIYVNTMCVRVRVCMCVLEDEEGVAAVKRHTRLQRYTSKER